MSAMNLRDALAPEWLGWIALLAGLVLAAATLEGLVRQFLLRQAYDWRAYAVSLADALGRRAIDALGLSVAAPVLAHVHAHRIATLPLDTAAQWLLLFLAHELAYYAYHRAAHRVRWFWATHAVHHSPNELTLAAALRLGWTGKLTGTALFFAPLVWLGFSPLAVFATLAVNLLYQFWLHTTWIPKLGPLEWVLNTPSHHRVHHASNPEYLDCNYGGVLIVYDRLFGSFVAERDDLPPRYGLTTPLRSCNPLYIALHEWLNLGRELAAARSLREAARALFAPPAARRAATAAAALPSKSSATGH
jgi:sterol desaturase/sphingolipid hydroxylase (fatty acid hydroxylase superfamily)